MTIEKDAMTNKNHPTLLVVDLAGLFSPQSLSREGIEVVFCPEAELSKVANTRDFVGLIVTAADDLSKLERVLHEFRGSRFYLPHLQAVFVQKNTPAALMCLHEYGVGYVYDFHEWEQQLQKFMMDVEEWLQTSLVSEMLSFGEQNTKQHKVVAQLLFDTDTSDYRTLYHLGRMCEAGGDFSSALTYYTRAVQGNSFFRPALWAKIECLLVLEHWDEVTALLLQIAEENPYSADCRFLLAAVYLEKGDRKNADHYLSEAMAINYLSPKRYELDVLRFLIEQNEKLSLAAVEKLSQPGSYIQVKMNEFGVNLSKSGQGKFAMQLYERVHQKVRPEQKYKITINLALTSYRMGDFHEALQFLDRCQKEFGRSFGKLEKIRARVQEALQQNSRAG